MSVFDILIYLVSYLLNYVEVVNSLLNILLCKTRSLDNTNDDNDDINNKV